MTSNNQHKPASDPRELTFNDRQFLLNGLPISIYAGELHYFRIPRPYWEHRLKQARALGLNAVCTYMPWNLHEPKPGSFDFEGDGGMLDVASFVQLAQSLGLLVILRPGPYICAEWDFGGLPGWLLKSSSGIPAVRCVEPDYLSVVERYFRAVGEQLKSLTLARGGPIAMVQVENEYGSFSNDKQYLQFCRKTLIDVGFDETLLFTSDGPQSDMLNPGTIDGTLAVANFGSKAEHGLSILKAFRPDQPVMCGEFWCGWFDQWGKPRQGTEDSTKAVGDLRWMVENDASFNIYMLHGGTNFGFTSGANYYDRYWPTVTSYDYRALVDEAGRPTAKYFAFRGVILSKIAPQRKVPDVPPRVMPIVRIPADRFKFTGSASLFDFARHAKFTASPAIRSMEQFDQTLGGAILYRTSVAGLGAGKLKIVEPRDYAIVYLDGVKIGTINRCLEQDSIELPEVAPEKPGTLDIVVWTFGRVNYGPRLMDRKGISERVELKHLTLSNWQVLPLPLSYADVAQLDYCDTNDAGPACHRGTFELAGIEIGDTFLDVSDWSMGCVWVNGHNLGRFWNIGPQQTVYGPGCWLRSGTNEFIVFDLESTGRQRIEGLDEPILDGLTSPS